VTSVPITRVVTVLMSGAIAFVLLVPLAIARHNPLLAVAIVVVFAAYLAANVLLWLRLKPRA